MDTPVAKAIKVRSRLALLKDPERTNEDERIAALEEIVHATKTLAQILSGLRSLDLPDAWLVSGGIYQSVWNHLTDKPEGYGIKDYDIIYFDGGDLSYDAEDQVIKKMIAALPNLADKLEVRNQARVHLWYEKRFGRPYAPLNCSMEALTTYAAKTHAVAARLKGDGSLEIRAPFGLTNIFAMRLVPNLGTNNKETFDEKGARMKQLWPELEIVPWIEA